MQRMIKLLLVLAIFTFGASSAQAVSSYVTTFRTTYPAAATSALANCVLCHINPGGGGTRNPYGNAFLAASHNYRTIETADSDGDGFTNVAEITALTFPGDATSHPAAAADTTPPTVTGFTIPATSTTLTVSGINFTATDNVGVTGYLITESSAAPAATATGWSATAPTSYTAATAGAKTLYAWAKDAAGNVSASRSASVTITLSSSDTTAPTVAGLAISAVTVSLSGFTATDNVGVTGYMVNESATAPTATATGWFATAPTSYTFTTTGAKTLYAWAKDAAGNVSTSRSASVTISFSSADTTTPTVTAFSVPATATSLTVPITSFTATDNVGVTGYLVNESATAPAATATGWSTTAPTSYTAASAGAHTLYAYAKDAAGNVSTSRSASVTISLSSSDSTAPTVTAFSVPATATSLTVPITSFTATDNVGVTGYLVNASVTAPAATATGWSATAPTSYTATSAGAKTLYAWAKDAAGNVSASRSASVTITLSSSDTTAPTVTAFTVPATAHSLGIPITLFTATDNVGVTGYIITESASAPAATATGWSATAPTSYTATSAGAKTLYARVIDAAGNVSTSRSASVTITALSKPSAIGVFRSGSWYLDTNGNGLWDDGTDKIVAFGTTGDIPVVGDWNHIGNASIGVFRGGAWYLKYLNGTATDNNGIPDKTIGYGLPGDIPVVGDWNRTGQTSIGVFRGGTWYLKNLNGTATDNNGTADITYSYGTAGDIPVVGDWSGDGKTKIGYFRPSNATWYLNLPGTGTWVGCGAPGDLTKDACYTGTFGVAGDVPLVGDWNGDGKSKIGYYRRSTNYWYLDDVGDGAWHGCGIDTCYDGSWFGSFGLSIDVPLAGAW